jgi:hypothetical protein
MPVILTEASARFEDVCTVEDAMEFIEYLRSNESASVDLSACTYLHTALLQLLRLARPRITHAPADPFLARWAGCGVTVDSADVQPVDARGGAAMTGRIS